ncbi:Indole-3-glycerol-phosphate synthase [Ammonifex degensii KC4]|uniref:Indole-3-glycerol phosphate synthase n=1 Tax=Ammonifex degensii (strain DSM 10501 / KC4) TaxID=429009 RepID=C9RDE9_AMMDK|nr:indole-3-glycerol phosphate synthase TrpC [Ammonifex degensii]ACX52276.1 Indole-3-glycerol-phosphate synthase [Ammonifex degensii KC4]
MLEKILTHKRAELSLRKKRCPQSQLEASLHLAPPPRPFAQALRFPGKVRIIAEIKRASPRGPIRPDADPVKIARLYQRGGAAAVSVLVDERFFGGKPAFLRLVRWEIDLPLLYKEFVLDPYQVYEARLLGADAVLLIARLLRTEELRMLKELAASLGMDSLVEVHSRDDLQKALAVGAEFIGINNRDLATFRVSLQTTRLLRPLIPPEVVVVSASGISSPLALTCLREWKVDAALIGEALMAAPDPEAKLRELVTAAEGGEGGCSE